MYLYKKKYGNQNKTNSLITFLRGNRFEKTKRMGPGLKDGIKSIFSDHFKLNTPWAGHISWLYPFFQIGLSHLVKKKSHFKDNHFELINFQLLPFWAHCASPPPNRTYFMDDPLLLTHTKGYSRGFDEGWTNYWFPSFYDSWLFHPKTPISPDYFFMTNVQNFRLMNP